MEHFTFERHPFGSVDCASGYSVGGRGFKTFVNTYRVFNIPPRNNYITFQILAFQSNHNIR